MKFPNFFYLSNALNFYKSIILLHVYDLEKISLKADWRLLMKLSTNKTMKYKLNLIQSSLKGNLIYKSKISLSYNVAQNTALMYGW